MLWKRIQHSWKGGQFNRELMGRTDLAKYPEAASEIENFIVHRTGCISKRRGSDEVADLAGLVGESARLFPLAKDKDFGHYVLMSGGKAYLLSSRGVLLSGGTWARSVGEGESAYSIEVPYGDSELAEIGYDQSGDTLFLAHRNHAPATIFRSGDSLEYKTLAFQAKRWAKPRVLKVENGGGAWGSGASKTVYYACTYVKDGVESEMSDPVEYTYKLPWGSGCTVNITCNKGNNTEEPDYYNIYKKESTEYGLIACEGKKVQSSVSPTATLSGAVAVVPRLTHNGVSANAAASASEYVGSVPGSLLVSTANGTVDYIERQTIWHKDAEPTYKYTTRQRTVANYNSLLVGGAGGGPTLVFSFGTASGTRVSDFTLALDAFCHAPYAHYSASLYGARANALYDYDATIAYGGATSFVVKLTTSNYSGTARTFTQTVNVSNPMGLTPAAGKVFWSSKGANASVSGEALAWGNITETGSALRRQLKVSFFDDINAAYGKNSWQTDRIEITAYAASGGAACNLYWHGVTFGTSRVQAEVFQDDCITPDLSSTPPVFADKFASIGDYPGVVGVYKQRLCFASSANEPFTFWMSCVGDLFNFSTHDSIREDDAIEASIAATEFPKINHMIVNRDMLLLSDGGEWKVSPVSGNTLSYRTISADKQSAIGSSPSLKPLLIGDEVVFAERTGGVLRATRYSVLSEGYETQDLSVLSSDIFRNNPIVSMAYQQSPDSIVWCVLADGTLASLVYMKEHEMVAWSHHTLGGGWAAVQVATNQSITNGTTELAVLVRRDGDWRLWKLRDDVLDGTRRGCVTMDGLRTLAAPGTPAADEALVALGDGTFALGHPIVARMTTTRPESDPKEGAVFEIVNATEVEAMVMDASTFSVRAKSSGERAGSGREVELEPTEGATEGEIGLYDGLCRKTVYGDNRRDGRIVLEHRGVWPLTVLSLSTTYQVEPANQTTGGGAE